MPYRVMVTLKLGSDRLRLDLRQINMNFINTIYRFERKKNREIFNEVMNFKFMKELDFIVGDERAFPGDEIFRRTGYSHTMLKRYFFTGRYFCRGKEVLDSCTGVGWGSYIISQYARQITAYDLDLKALEFARKYWLTSHVKWTLGDALDHQFLKGKKFDIGLAMETIEHFTKQDGERYIENLSESIKEGGYLIGTSTFPKTREEADKLGSVNPYHLYISTDEEIISLLKKHFRVVILIQRWMFIAQK